MALEAVKPQFVKRRFKIFVYGNPGAGKTFFGISFPDCYLIDTEGGGIPDQHYVDMLTQNNGVYLKTNDYNRLIGNLRSLISEKHQYKTLIIDPITELYSKMIQDAEDQLLESMTKNPKSWGRQWNIANSKFKRIISLLIQLDMNIIITAHSKTNYGKDMEVLGTTFDSYKKSDYLFDLMVEVVKLGQTRTGVVRKSRYKAFPEGLEFPFSYDAVAEKYGRDVIERDTIIAHFATPEQIREFSILVSRLGYSNEKIQEGLDHFGAAVVEDMLQENMQKVINNLKVRTGQNV